MTQQQLKDEVTIICYNQKETRTRGEAIEFYKDCAMNSEGSEQKRYFNILMGLEAGKLLCTDL